MGVIEIREKSERSRKKSIQLTLERGKKADLRVQERLALRKRAKQSKVLQNCSPFAKLTEQAQEKIIDKMTYGKINSGEIVCQEGKQAERMYLLMSGQCNVEVDSKKVSELKELDVFGEAALFGTIDDVSTRSATVIAKSNLEVLVLLRDDLNELIKSGDLDSECIKALQKVAQQRKIQNIKQLKSKANTETEEIQHEVVNHEIVNHEVVQHHEGKVSSESDPYEGEKAGPWTTHLDPASGHFYYLHGATHETVWERPPEYAGANVSNHLVSDYASTSSRPPPTMKRSTTPENILEQKYQNVQANNETDTN